MKPQPPDRLTIALNGLAAVTGGGVTYWLNLLPALAELGRPHRYLVLLSARQKKIQIPLPPNFELVRIGFRRPASLRRMIWEQTMFPRFLRREGVDVLLAAAEVAPLRCPCPFVLAVRNANPHWGPRASTLQQRVRERILRRLTIMSARQASRVVFVSRDSQNRLSAGLGVEPGRSSVIYHGIGRNFLGPVLQHDSLIRARAAPYILSVSAVRGHKDFEALLRAYSRFVVDHPEGRVYELVIAGALIDHPYHKHLLRCAHELGIETRVSFTGDLPYDDLPPLYRGARVFVLASRAETFGHPLVEAMASGVPIVSTDLDVSREICGDAAEYYPPGDSERLGEALAGLTSNEELRARRIAAGLARAKDFAWSTSARMTLDALEAAAQTVGRERSKT